MTRAATVTRAELESVRWGPVVVTSLTAAALVALDLTVWPRGPGSELTWLVAGLLGGSAALALDDPAATVTRAVPVGVPLRTAIRLGVAAVAVAAWCGYAARVVAAVRADGGTVSWPALALVGVSLVCASTGAAAALGAGGEPGAVVAGAAVLVALGLMVVPLPWSVAPYDVGSAGTRETVLWLGVAALGVGGLVWGARDPQRR